MPVDEEIKQQLRTAVEEQRNLFSPGTSVQCVVRQGSLIPELLRLLAQKSVDLFCLGRRPAKEHDLLSDAAMALVHKATCSVLVVPSGTEPTYNRILVPVDFSDHSREALEVACALARARPGVSLLLLHVYSVPQGWHKSPHSYEEFAAIMRGHAERHGKEYLRTVDNRDIPWLMRYEWGEQVPWTILGVADEIDADLIVLGSHGRTRPAGVLLGHVADTVCRGQHALSFV